MASFLCALPRTREALYSLLPYRSVNQPTRRLKQFSVISIPPQRPRLFSNELAISVAREGQMVRSPDLVALEYADLNLSDKISEELGHVRIRQHVNPLSSWLSVPAPVPDWSKVYREPTLPLMVDIGSGSGRFLLSLAKRNLDSKNYLGLEIRHKLVKRAEVWANELALRNIHFMFANATVFFKQLVSTYPGP